MTECDTCGGHLDTAASALLQPPLDDRTQCASRRPLAPGEGWAAFLALVYTVDWFQPGRVDAGKYRLVS